MISDGVLPSLNSRFSSWCVIILQQLRGNAALVGLAEMTSNDYVSLSFGEKYHEKFRPFHLNL